MSISCYFDASTKKIEDTYPYETEEFHKCWWKYLSPKFNILKRFEDFLIHRKTLFKGLLRLNELRISGWNNAWSQDLTVDRVMAFKLLPDDFKWDYLGMIWTENRQSNQALSMLENSHIPVINLSLTPEHIIDLTGGYEEYLKRISRNSRKNIRQKFARAKDLKPELFFYEGSQCIEEFFSHFFKLHIDYWTNKKGRSYFSDLCEQEFITAWAKELHKSGKLILDGIKLEDKVVNLGLSIVSGDTRYMLLTINTGTLPEYFPGILGLHLRLQHAALSGISTVNLGFGESEYKTSFSTGYINRFLMLAPNPKSLKGKLYVSWLQRSNTTNRRQIF